MKFMCHNCDKEFDEPYILVSKFGMYDERCPYCGSISFEIKEE